jgi:copper transport protein
MTPGRAWGSGVGFGQNGHRVIAATPNPRLRRAARLPVGLAVVGTLLLLWALPASAHAVVLASTPGDGQVVTAAPDEVRIDFSEAVSIDLGGLTVVDTAGSEVQQGEASLSGGDRILRVGLEGDLDEGTYVANYRVVSADGHPISGAIVFGVGAGTVVDQGAAAGLAVSTDPAWEIAGAVARFATYVAALLAAGLGLFLGFVHDQDRDRWRLTPVVRFATVLAAVAGIVTVGTQAALATGGGLDAATDVSTLRTVLTEGLGWQSIILLGGLALLHLSTDTNRLIVAQALAFYGWLAVGVAFAFWGHATGAPNVAAAVVADAVHVLAAAFWFGGVVGLWVTLARRRPARAAQARSVGAAANVGLEPTPGPDRPSSTDAEPPEVGTGAGRRFRPGSLESSAHLVGRFSTLAAISVGLLGAAGLALSWQEVDEPANLLSTTYGRLLLAKVLVVLAIVGVAAYNRFRLVPEIVDPREDDDDEIRASEAAGFAHLVRTLRLEALGIVAVLVLTAVLVNVTPARVSGAGREPAVFNQTAPLGDQRLNLVVAPGTPGPNTMHIQLLDADGRPTDGARAATVEYRLPDKGVETVSREGTYAGPGHFIVDGAELPLTGTWEVTVVARLSDFEQDRTVFQVPIR